MRVGKQVLLLLAVAFGGGKTGHGLAPAMTPGVNYKTPSTDALPVAAAPGVAPSAERNIVPGVSSVEDHEESGNWASTVTLSPTPLYSAFSRIDSAYETEEDQEEDFLPNIAVNSSCILSSSSSSSGTFCRLSDDENQRIATASEDNPFILIDLEDLYFIDILSFAVNVDSVSSRSRLSVMCLNNTHADLIRTDASMLPYSWQKTVLQNSGNYSFHVHAACQVVRLQRLSLGPLVIANLKIYGTTIKNRDVIGCMAGHDGDICSGYGSCQSGKCSCTIGFSGAFCENFLLTEYLISFTQVALTVSLFVGLTLHYQKLQKRGSVDAQDAKTALLLSHADQEEPQRSISRSSSGSVSESIHSKVSFASYEEPADVPLKLTRAVSTPVQHGSAHEWEGAKQGSLHLLFASPLVMAVNAKGSSEETLRPIQALDIRREQSLLQQSLRRGSVSPDLQIPLTVSVATIDKFHLLMTLGNVRCLHFSGHCTKDFLAFEDASGQLHQIKMPTLRGLLRSTVTPKTLKTLRMVVLNACNSENAALEFVLAGVPHVIGYKKRIRDSTATTFTQALYLSLACGRTVRDAFESAKEAVYSSPSFDKNEIDSFVLLPERGDHTEVLWDETSGSNEKVQRWPMSENMRPLPPLADDFIGRHVDLWQVLCALTQRKRRLIIVNGELGSGKTQLATAAAHHLHLRRSRQVFRDGVFVVKNSVCVSAPPLVQLASLIDSVYRAMFQLLTNPHAHDLDGSDFDACQGNIDGVKKAEKLVDFVETCDGDLDDRVLRRKILSKVNVLSEALVERQANCLLVLDAVEETSELVHLFLTKLLEEVPDLQILVTCEKAYQLPLDVNLQHFNLGPLSPGDSALLFIRHLKRKILVSGEEITIEQLSRHPIVANAQGKPLDIVRAARELACKFNSNSPVELPPSP